MRQEVGLSTVTGAVIMILAAASVGYVVRLATEAEDKLQRAARLEAAARERARLARDIHDSVLQVLAMVQRRGAELGGEAAELGRLAGEQEAALRALVSESQEQTRPGTAAVNLVARLEAHAGPDVTLAAPAGAVPVPGEHRRRRDGRGGRGPRQRPPPRGRRSRARGSWWRASPAP